MRVTIIADDNNVYVEEHALKVDLTGLDDEIHAVQWYGTVGEIEYRHDHITNERKQNERIDDFSPYQMFVDRWMVEAQKPDPVAVPAPAPAPARAAGTEPMNVIA